MKVKEVLRLEEAMREGRMSSGQAREALNTKFLLDLEREVRASARAEKLGQLLVVLVGIPFYLLDVVVYIPAKLVEAIGEAIRRARG